MIAAWKKHGNMAVVARNSPYSYKRVKYWVDRYKKSGDVTARTLTGRKKAISTEAPIENVWAIVQKQVDATCCKNFKEFEACVIEKLKNLDPDIIENLFGSMAKRIRLCIEANGDKIKY